MPSDRRSRGIANGGDVVGSPPGASWRLRSSPADPQIAVHRFGSLAEYSAPRRRYDVRSEELCRGLCEWNELKRQAIAEAEEYELKFVAKMLL